MIEIASLRPTPAPAILKTIDYDSWQNVTFDKAAEIFFNQPLFWPPPLLSSHGIYGFFVIKDDREYLAYIGRGYLYDRLRNPSYHHRWCISDAVRVLPIPVRRTPRVRNFAEYLAWIDTLEVRMILRYNRPETSIGAAVVHRMNTARLGVRLER